MTIAASRICPKLPVLFSERVRLQELMTDSFWQFKMTSHTLTRWPRHRNMQNYFQEGEKNSEQQVEKQSKTDVCQTSSFQFHGFGRRILNISKRWRERIGSRKVDAHNKSRWKIKKGQRLLSAVLKHQCTCYFLQIYQFDLKASVLQAMFKGTVYKRRILQREEPGWRRPRTGNLHKS